eukprot:TRINITY_DN64847_c0_g1_i1.p1 TRINITY_DN64847_c0_g1~~TRINITY_DN64847_c0_g1_i1.p1  ORF type:complete len:297 (-),score=70.06 TRINITY_DN64847_c0_g1_i1:41-868(-)
MTVRAATARLKMPEIAVRLKKLLDGLPAGAPASRGLADDLSQWFEVRYGLGQMGFAPNYFEEDFLQGAAGALTHVASVLPTAGTAEDLTGSLLDTGLRDLWKDNMRDLDAENLRLSWDIEDIDDVALGNVKIIFGLRRRDIAMATDARRADFGRHSIVVRGEGSGSIFSDLAASREYGATLTAEALITCKQSVKFTLAKPPGDGSEGGSTEEVILQSAQEAVTHCLKLEADLQGSTAQGEVPLYFNESKGWSALDLNYVLRGNDVCSHLRQMSPE